MIRKIILVLLASATLISMTTAIFLVFYHPPHPANQNFSNPSPVRAVRVDFLDESKSRAEVPALETLMQQAGVNLVALGAGRADWTYFPWKNHPDRWSSDVKTSGMDYLLEDSSRFSKWAHVSAVVDVLAPLYIKTHPEAAAISWLGVPSKNLVATMELVDGKFGQELLDMMTQIAANYPVNSITLTELIYYVDGYGEQDKAAFMAYTGSSDWPRTAGGQININDTIIGKWRSYELARFLKKAADVVHLQKKQFFVEIRIGVEPSGQVFLYDGVDFNLFLIYADRLVVRGNSDPNGRSPQTTTALARYLANYQNGRVILTISMWDKNYDLGIPKNQMSAVSAADFQATLQSAAQGGMHDFWITPSFLMSIPHWQVLSQLWGTPSPQ